MYMNSAYLDLVACSTLCFILRSFRDLIKRGWRNSTDNLGEPIGIIGHQTKCFARKHINEEAHEKQCV